MLVEQILLTVVFILELKPVVQFSDYFLLQEDLQHGERFSSFTQIEALLSAKTVKMTWLAFRASNLNARGYPHCQAKEEQHCSYDFLIDEI